ncbi:TPA: hypothetical protein ACJCQR_000368 [Neisseria meningitidis]|uniref:hypothetical protein n=1 Tax=Neisseria meningitidis TaxID=487 RepID=UPI001864A6A7|nr:hypothetical protein [Neisseria meningitidis]MBH2050056.1 hypothetical protein [Neisseria meningitidis]MBH2082123.1 hypothetical protein [Neisseria meningitidis]MBH2249944.1 hypothetical protein [Neisseria meningitidis]MBH5610988.1 hypothetical protein [Neisseria meningitidis]MBH5666712.1 hypothetical protein [Neisseria meningitidis]
MPSEMSRRHLLFYSGLKYFLRPKNESDTAYLKEWLKTAVSNTTKCRLNISDGI